MGYVLVSLAGYWLEPAIHRLLRVDPQQVWWLAAICLAILLKGLLACLLFLLTGEWAIG